MTSRRRVIPKNGMWAVLKDGARRASRVFETQYEAIEFGKGLSKKEECEFVIHGRNGRIRQANSYGGDPCPPRDKK